MVAYNSAYSIATALSSGGVLTESACQHVLDLIGQPGVSELIYLVGHCCFVPMTLNGFDIPVTDRS
jgi:4-carboxymuconolactone decarboxylase